MSIVVHKHSLGRDGDSPITTAWTDYIPVLDKGYVRLEAALASDLDPTNSARVSFGTRKTEMDERDEGLVKFLVRERHGCYDSDTEVLTRHGWKLWPEVVGDEEFMTLSPSGAIEWQRAERVIHKDISGPMIRVKTRHVDLLVTPDHNMLARRRTKEDGPMTLVPAQNFTQACHRVSMGGGEWEGMGEEYSPIARLLGLFIGDGHFSGNSIEFNLRKERTIEFLRREAALAGFEVRGEGTYRLIADKEFRQMAAECYTEDREKRIPSFALDWGVDSLTELFEGMMEADGHVSASGKRSYFTSSKLLAGQVQEVAVKCALAATVRPINHKPNSGRYGTKQMWVVTVYRAHKARPRVGWTVAQRARQVTTEHYEGTVHCVTVPNGTLYVRRNGRPVWCGNSPTEHSFFRFEVKAPIFVVREWQRHRISSFNEASGRYMELAREWYQPALEDYRVQKGKAGAYYFEQDPDEARVAFADERINTVCNDAFDAYEAMLARGVAKEIARMVLPLNTYTSMWVSVNPRSLMNFLSLRNAPSAQYEIRAYAEVMEEIFKQVMPVTAEAFVQNGRVSP